MLLGHLQIGMNRTLVKKPPAKVQFMHSKTMTFRTGRTFPWRLLGKAHPKSTQCLGLASNWWNSFRTLRHSLLALGLFFFSFCVYWEKYLHSKTLPWHTDIACAASTVPDSLTEATHSDPLDTVAITQRLAVHALDNSGGIPFYRAGNKTNWKQESHTKSVIKTSPNNQTHFLFSSHQTTVQIIFGMWKDGLLSLLIYFFNNWLCDAPFVIYFSHTLLQEQIQVLILFMLLPLEN